MESSADKNFGGSGSSIIMEAAEYFISYLAYHGVVDLYKARQEMESYGGDAGGMLLSVSEFLFKCGEQECFDDLGGGIRRGYYVEFLAVLMLVIWVRAVDNLRDDELSRGFVAYCNKLIDLSLLYIDVILEDISNLGDKVDAAACDSLNELYGFLSVVVALLGTDLRFFALFDEALFLSDGNIFRNWVDMSIVDDCATVLEKIIDSKMNLINN